MKTIFTFVAGVIAGLFGWTCTLLWLDEHDDSFIIKGFPNANKRYQKDIGRAYDDGKQRGKEEFVESIEDSLTHLRRGD